MAIKAIETQYRGHLFRSRLEARWAIFFDCMGIQWEYEPEGFDVDGTWYLPDFRCVYPLGDKVLFEVKPLGYMPTQEQRDIWRQLDVFVLSGPPDHVTYYQPHLNGLVRRKSFEGVPFTTNTILEQMAVWHPRNRPWFFSIETTSESLGSSLYSYFVLNDRCVQDVLMILKHDQQYCQAVQAAKQARFSNDLADCSIARMREILGAEAC